MRAAVIGAGISGLTVARRLKEISSVEVEIYEQNSQVGGKILSHSYEGKIYELGAVVATPDYVLISQLVEELNIKKIMPEETTFINGLGSQVSIVSHIEERFGKAHLLKALAKFWRIIFDCPELLKAGFVGLDHRFFAPMARFAKDEGIEPVTELVRPFLTGCGYGYYEEVPAAYFLKLAPWVLKRGTLDALTLGLTSNWFFVEGGWKVLSDHLATNLKVHFNAHVSKIKRSVHGVTVETSNGEARFDLVILACDPRSYMSFLDYTAEEHALALQVKYIPYLVTLAQVPGGKTTAFIDSTTRMAVGSVNYIVRPHFDSDVCQIYQILPPKIDEDFLRHERVKAAQLCGGGVEKEILKKYWTYFPHVDSNSCFNRFYDRMQNLQGKNRTFYVGGFLSFESLEHAAEFSRGIADNIVSQLEF